MELHSSLTIIISVSLAYVSVRPRDVHQFHETHGKSVKVDMSG